MSRFALEPVSLAGQHVRLVPLAPEHRDALAAAVVEGNLHHLWFTSVPSPEGMGDEIDRRLELQRAGSMLPFTVLDLGTESPVGMTTFMNIDVRNRRLEIGSTWYAERVQRSPVNTEAKLLLLAHAFDRLGCVAVEFRTHFLNGASRRAIERLGAKLDGILRSHQIAANGTLRDTCVYSITAAEWPAIRAHLEWQLTRPR